MALTLQQQLEELLHQAQTALEQFGTGNCDDDMTASDFKQMIAKELESQNIPATNERILAVAEWAVDGVQGNGIHIYTAIVESIEVSVDELLNNDLGDVAVKSVFNLIELDCDLENESVEVYVETYATRKKAQEELKRQYQEVELGLKEDDKGLFIENLGYEGDQLISVNLKRLKVIHMIGKFNRM